MPSIAKRHRGGGTHRLSKAWEQSFICPPVENRYVQPNNIQKKQNKAARLLKTWSRCDTKTWVTLRGWGRGSIPSPQPSWTKCGEEKVVCSLAVAASTVSVSPFLCGIPRGPQRMTKSALRRAAHPQKAQTEPVLPLPRLHEEACVQRGGRVRVQGKGLRRFPPDTTASPTLSSGPTLPSETRCRTPHWP